MSLNNSENISSVEKKEKATEMKRFWEDDDQSTNS